MRALDDLLGLDDRWREQQRARHRVLGHLWRAVVSSRPPTDQQPLGTKLVLQSVKTRRYKAFGDVWDCVGRAAGGQGGIRICAARGCNFRSFPASEKYH